jgi:hypothetical protein
MPGPDACRRFRPYAYSAHHEWRCWRPYATGDCCLVVYTGAPRDGSRPRGIRKGPPPTAPHSSTVLPEMVVPVPVPAQALTHAASVQFAASGSFIGYLLSAENLMQLIHHRRARLLTSQDAGYRDCLGTEPASRLGQRDGGTGRRTVGAADGGVVDKPVPVVDAVVAAKPEPPGIGELAQVTDPGVIPNAVHAAVLPASDHRCTVSDAGSGCRPPARHATPR